jgi:hypothetical protein
MKTSKLLTDPKPGTFRISLRLQESKTVDLVFNDRFIARTHWDQLHAQGVFSGLVIKEYKFDEL